MKKYLIAVLIAIVCALGAVSTATAQTSVSFQVFYDDLSPYGSWVDYGNYGYVWVPHAEPGFRPYFTNGHWAYTDQGWLWVSNYNWGWAPFHYGSWVYDGGYGWLWVPDYAWAPAWVEWGYYDDYYGWAPIGPHFSFTIASRPPISHWCFVHPSYINSPEWQHHYFIAHGNQIRIRDNVVINNPATINIVNHQGNYNQHTYYYGPRPQEVERITKQPVRAMNIQDRNTTGRTQVNGNAVTIYRPRIAENKSARPQEVKPLRDAKINPGASSRQPSINPERNEQRTDQMKQRSNDRMPADKAAPPVNSRPEPVKPKIQRSAPARSRTDAPSRRTYSPAPDRQRTPAMNREISRPPQQENRNRPPR
jgi:hypothetical protein